MTQNLDFKSETVRLRGIDVHVRTAGSGQPLLYLHPASGFQDAPGFFGPLAENHRLIVPDHPGFGASDTPDWIRTIGDMAYFYLELLEEMDLAQVCLVGSSLGGWIAAEMAIRDVSRISSLTLMAPAGLRVKGLEAGDIFLWNRTELAENLFFDPAYSQAMLSVQPSPEAIEVALKNRYTTARLGWEPRFYNPELARWAHRIRIPVLLLWGEADKIFPLPFAEAWTERLSDVRLEVLPRCGHVPQVEAADDAARRIATFFQGAAA